MQNITPDAAGGGRAGETLGAEVVRGLGAEAKPASAVGGIGGIAQGQLFHLVFLAFQLGEVVRLAGAE